MAFEKLLCSVSYPGLQGADSASYTCNQGVNPDVVTIVTGVEPLNVYRFGDVTFQTVDQLSGVVRRYTIPDCRVERILPNYSKAGNSWTIILSDHRWKWENALVNGVYNLEDEHQNLVKGFVKSPRQLGKILCEALGETGFDVSILPEDVTDTKVPDNPQPGAGEGVKSVKPELNPYVNWDCFPAKEALARLCDSFFMVPVWCNVERKLKVCKRSEGGTLPTDRIDTASGQISLPPTASGYGVIGAPIRFQLRFVCDLAVGANFDGSLRDINKLPYRPDLETKPGQVGVSVIPPVAVSGTYTITVEGRFFSYTIVGGETAADVLNAIASQVSADGSINSLVSASVDPAGPTLNITGKADGYDPTVDIAGAGTFTAAANAFGVQNAWEASSPPLFPGVRTTANLSFNRAMELAQSTVFKLYQMTLKDPSKGPTDPQTPLIIPKYGQAVDPHDIVLLPTKVQQVAPEIPDPNRLGGSTGQLIADVPNYYDGWSRDQPAECFGKVSVRLASPIHLKITKGQENTRYSDRLEVPFSVNASSYLVQFGSPVFEIKVLDPADVLTQPLPGGAKPVKQVPRTARIVLETSCFLRDRETKQILRYRRWVSFKPDPKDADNKDRKKPKELPRKDNDDKAYVWDKDVNIKWFQHDDVVRSWVNKYDVNDVKGRHAIRATVADEYDNATKAADKYLTEHLRRIVTEGGETNSYGGIQPVKLDGAICQLSIDFDREGLTTRVSRNLEHDAYIPTYDTRRKREAIEPGLDIARANRENAPPITDRAGLETIRQGGISTPRGG